MKFFSIFLFFCFLCVSSKAKCFSNEYGPNLNKQFKEVKNLEEDSAFYDDSDSINEEKTEPRNTDDRTKNSPMERSGANSEQHAENINDGTKISEVGEEQSRKEDTKKAEKEPTNFRRKFSEDTPNEGEKSDTENATAEEERKSLKKVNDDVDDNNDAGQTKKMNDPSEDEKQKSNDDTVRMASSPDLVINMKGRSGEDHTSLDVEEIKPAQKLRQSTDSGRWTKRKSHETNDDRLPKMNIPYLSPRTLETITPNPLPHHLSINIGSTNLHRSSEHKSDRSEEGNQSLPKKPIASRLEKPFKTIDDYSLTDSYQLQPTDELRTAVNPFVLRPSPPPMKFPGFFNNPEVNNFRRNFHFFPLFNRNRMY